MNFLVCENFTAIRDESTIDAFLATLKYLVELFLELIWIITFKLKASENMLRVLPFP